MNKPKKRNNKSNKNKNKKNKKKLEENDEPKELSEELKKSNESENIDEDKLLKKLNEIYRIRRKKNIMAVIFLSSFILCINISLFILTNVIVLEPIYAVIFTLLGVLFLAIGIYLMLDNPPIYVE